MAQGKRRTKEALLILILQCDFYLNTCHVFFSFLSFRLLLVYVQIYKGTTPSKWKEGSNVQHERAKPSSSIARLTHVSPNSMGVLRSDVSVAPFPWHRPPFPLHSYITMTRITNSYYPKKIMYWYKRHSTDRPAEKGNCTSVGSDGRPWRMCRAEEEDSRTNQTSFLSSLLVHLLLASIYVVVYKNNNACADWMCM